MVMMSPNETSCIPIEQAGRSIVARVLVAVDGAEGLPGGKLDGLVDEAGGAVAEDDLDSAAVPAAGGALAGFALDVDARHQGVGVGDGAAEVVVRDGAVGAVDGHEGIGDVRGAAE